MKKAIFFGITFILSVISAYTVMFAAVTINNLLSLPESFHSVSGLAFYFLAVISILLIIKKLTETIMPLSTKEGLLYWRIKKHFPKSSEVKMRKGYLFISWDSKVKDVTHNYEFEIDFNKAIIYDTTDQVKIIFKGTIEQVILKLK